MGKLEKTGGIGTIALNGVEAWWLEKIGSGNLWRCIVVTLTTPLLLLKVLKYRWKLLGRSAGARLKVARNLGRIRTRSKLFTPTMVPLPRGIGLPVNVAATVRRERL